MSKTKKEKENEVKKDEEKKDEEKKDELKEDEVKEIELESQEIQNQVNEEKLCKNCYFNESIFNCKYCKKMMCYQCVLDKSTILIKELHKNKSCYECWEEYVEDYSEKYSDMNEKKIEKHLSYLDNRLNLPNETLIGLHDGWLIQCEICHNVWNGIEKCLCNMSDKTNDYIFDEATKEKSIKCSLDPIQKNIYINNVDLKNELLNDAVLDEDIDFEEGIEIEQSDMYEDFPEDENLENENYWVLPPDISSHEEKDDELIE